MDIKQHRVRRVVSCEVCPPTPVSSRMAVGLSPAFAESPGRMVRAGGNERHPQARFSCRAASTAGLCNGHAHPPTDPSTRVENRAAQTRRTRENKNAPWEARTPDLEVNSLTL